MRRIYAFLLTMLMVLAANAETRTITQDFNDCNWTSNYDYVTNENLPEGWFITSSNTNSSTQTSNGVDGTKCIKTTNTTTLITKAYGDASGATISCRVKKTSNFAAPSVILYKMTANGDGTFTKGDILHTYDMSNVTNSSFEKISWNGLTEEECWIGIDIKYVYFDDYENTYEITAAAETYTVSGSVTKDGAGTPLVEASVSLSGKNSYTATTGDDGSFTIAEVEPGEYTLTVTAEGYQNKVQTITVKDANVKIPAVQLSQTESVLNLTVLSGTTYNGLSGVTVTIYDGEVSVSEGTTDLYGFVELKVLGKVAPSYTMEAKRYGYTDISQPVTFDEGGTKKQQIILDEEKLRFFANVKNSSDEAITNATVMVTRDATGASTRATNRGNGRYEYLNMTVLSVTEGETFSVSISADGYISETYSFNFDEGNLEKDFVLYKPTTFSGVVSDAAGTLIEGAKVVLSDGEGNAFEEVMTDATGNYSFSVEGELAGKYTVTVTADYYLAGEEEINEPVCEDAIVRNITLELRKLAFTATVKDSKGEAITDAEVKVKSGESVLETTNNGDGTYTYAVVEKSLMEGETFIVNVSAEGYTAAEAYTLSFAGEDVAESFTLYKPTVISGVVKDSEGDAVEGATVTLYNGTEIAERMKTDAEGAYSFTIEGELPESYTVKVTAVAYCDDYEGTVTAEREAANTEDVTLELVRLTFTATVKDSKGEAISDAKVVVTRGENDEEATANEDGSYAYAVTVKSLTEGETFIVNVSAEGYTAAEAYEFSFAGEDAAKEFVLYKPTVISGTVKSDNGAVEGATVTLADNNGNKIDEVTTGADGAYSFTIEGELAESYTLTIEADGYDKKEQTIDNLEREANIEGEDITVSVTSAIATAKTAKRIEMVDGQLYVSGNTAIYDLSGRLVKTVKAGDARVKVDLSAGCYIIGGKKVNIR